MGGFVELKQVGAVLTVALNRPDVHNAMNPGLIGELMRLFGGEIPGRDDVRVVVLTGNGRSFCAGADLTTMRAAADFTFAENVADGEAIFDLMAAIDNCPKPVIARVNGAAIGGGVGLVACADIVVAVARAKFAFSEVRLGIVPAVISPYVLAKIGERNGRELFLTGERFDAHKAQEIGLVHHVVADEAALDTAVAERIQALLQAAPSAQAAIKQLIKEVIHQPKAATREQTANLIAQRRASDEGKEGMSSFLEKRKPWWQGED
ncbi:MAG: enoyl-CoA hydratase-related protein [Candidatus Promineifilaceae bacterium]